MKVAVCEDNCIDRKILENVFCQMKEWNITRDYFESGEELLLTWEDNMGEYELFILDIQLSGMSGIEVAQKIREVDKMAIFIFLTGYSQYKDDAIDVITLAYIEKPITVQKLDRAFTKASFYIKDKGSYLDFKCKGNKYHVSVNDIIYIERRCHAVNIVTQEKAYLTRLNFDELLKNVDRELFAQCHYSFLINLHHLYATNKKEVIMDNGKKLSITRKFADEYEKTYLKFIGKTS